LDSPSLTKICFSKSKITAFSPLFNIKGEVILPIEYISLGCISKTSSDRTLNNILIIPEIEGIVVCKEIETDSRKNDYYGIYNSRGKELVAVALDTVYSITVSGREEYTMTNAGNSFDVIEYVKQQFKEQYTNNNANVITNETTNETTNEVQNNNIVNEEVNNIQN